MSLRTSARLFLALWPGPADLVSTLALRSAMPWPAAARLISPDSLHVTLHFIGAVPRDRLLEVTDGLVVPAPRVELLLDHAEVWPGGIAVLTTKDAPAALAQLHVQLAGVLLALGLPVEKRAYRPHVTLARHAQAFTPAAGPIEPVSWRASEYVLVESAESRYKVLRRYPAPTQ